MKQIKVYDVPTRIFHWTFGILFLISFVIAKTVDDDSLLFSYHMISGLILSFTVFLRILWGVFGTHYAKFKNFDLSLKSLINYFKGVLTNSNPRWPGHNPASSWGTIIMFIIVLSLGFTGMFMTKGYKEELEDAHELLANSFLILVILHILGIVIHSLQHRDQIALSMLTGNKNLIDGNEHSVPNKSAEGAVFLVAVIIFASYLNTNFNKETRELIIFETRLSLGELPKSNLDLLPEKIERPRHDQDDEE